MKISLALVVWRVALVTITITSKIYTQSCSTQLHTNIYKQKYYECMHA